MYVLIEPFIRLCLLKANPQDLPASTPLLGICLVAHMLVSTATAAPLYGLGWGMMLAGLEAALLLGYARVALQIGAHLARYTQTTSALAGTGAIMGALALPPTYSLISSAPSGHVNQPALFVYLLAFGWLLVVYGHIYRHALSIGLPIGVLVSFGYVVATGIVIETVFVAAD